MVTDYNVCPRCSGDVGYNCGCDNHELLEVMVDPRDYADAQATIARLTAELEAEKAKRGALDLGQQDAARGHHDRAVAAPAVERGVMVAGVEGLHQGNLRLQGASGQLAAEAKLQKLGNARNRAMPTVKLLD